ncbi:MAG: septum formation initiator family protein [bacterium]
MRNFQQKRGWRNIVRSRPVLFILGLLVLFFAFGVVGFYRKTQITEENKRLAESKLVELQKQKEKLSSDIAKLQTTEGTEETIREKFGLAKEGEGVIVVVDDKTTKEVPKTSPGFFSWLFFWKNWFK